MIHVGNEGGSVYFSQCVAPTPQDVDLVFYSKALASGGGLNIGTGSVLFFDTPDCSNAFLQNRSGTRVESLADGWKRQTLLGISPPPTTRAAMVFLSNRLSVAAGDGSATVASDDAAFGPAGTI